MEFNIEINDKKENIIKFASPLSFEVKGKSIEEIIQTPNLSDKPSIINNFQVKLEKENIIDVTDNSGRIIAIIFKVPIKVIYRNFDEREILIDEKVYSSFQINKVIEHFKIKNPYFYNERKTKLDFDSSNLLFHNNSFKVLEIINSEKKYVLKKNEVFLGQQKCFERNLLSEYFDEYFVYPKDETKFNYFTSDKRTELITNIRILINSKSTTKPITKFKISGPCSEGKSVTLLYASRIFTNIIYLNVKVLIKLYKSNKIKDYLDILIYEFGRLDFPSEKNDEYKKSFEKTFNDNINKTPWELFVKLSSFLKDKDVILIFDQFKDKYVSNLFFEDIKTYLNPSFKIIISSSINDKEVGDKVADSLYNNKGNQKFLSYENQDEYFYYSDLINKNDFKILFSQRAEYSQKSEQLELFNYEPKYLTELKNKDLGEIEEHIIIKMKEHCAKLKIDFDIYIFNIYSKIGRRLNYEFLNLKTISLKYCKLNFENEYFTVKYKFKFIENIILKQIKQIDAQDYFNKKKFNDNELYNALKGYFFEFASIQDIKNKKSEIFQEPIEYVLPVKTIVGMKYSENLNLNEINNNLKEQSTIKRMKYRDLLEQNFSLIKKEIDLISGANKDNKKDKNIILDRNIGQSFNIGNTNNLEYLFYQNLEKEENNLNILLGKKRKENEDQDKDKDKGLIKKSSKSKKKEKTTIQTYKGIKLDEDVEYIKYSENFKNGNILIVQKQLTGETVDLGFLCGKKYNKKFIGLQMKFYDNNSHLKNPITKSSIKEKIQPILLNCFENLDIKIKEWHYIMCLYYCKDENTQYNASLIQNCNNNDIEYIYFDPSQKTFYDKFEKPLKRINTNFKSNIDFISNFNPYQIFKNTDFIEKYEEQTANETITKVESNDIFGVKKKEVIRYLKKLLNKTKPEKIEIKCKFKLIEEYNFPIPQNLYCLLFKSKSNNLLYYYNVDNQLKCKEQNNLATIIPPSFVSNYVKIDENKGKKEDIYFYVLKISI